MEHKALDNARDSFVKFEHSQEYTYTERMRYFEEGVDWLTALDGTPLELLAAKIKKIHKDKLIKDIPFPLKEIVEGWLTEQPASWFSKFHEEDLHNAAALIRALWTVL